MMSRLLLICSLLLAFGCDSPKATRVKAPAPASAPKAKPKAAAEEVPEVATADEYIYSPVGKRDPFRSFVDRLLPAADVAADPLCGMLCTWELEQLRLVAVVSGMASPLAMVQDPKGNGFNLRRGASIGKRNGKVTEILRDRIVVTEHQRLGTGEIIPSETEILLRTARADSVEAPLDLLVTDDG